MFKGLFDACKKIDPGTIYNDGLSFEEVMQRPCVEFLTTVLGLDEDQIENDFKRVDTDGNSRVTQMEGRDAFNQLRSKVYHVKQDFECCDSHGVCESERISLDTTNPDLESCPQSFFLEKTYGRYGPLYGNGLTQLRVFCKSVDMHKKKAQRLQRLYKDRSKYAVSGTCQLGCL